MAGLVGLVHWPLVPRLAQADQVPQFGPVGLGFVAPQAVVAVAAVADLAYPPHLHHFGPPPVFGAADPILGDRHCFSGLVDQEFWLYWLHYQPYCRL